LVNVQSKIHAEGIDIMMVLDASGSMQCFDDVHDQRMRFEVAKKEAIRFIDKRENDPIGLVIFGKDALSRCPLTLDKTIVKTIINELNLGDINPDGTVLSIAMSMAAKRLKDSKAKSKIMIVLTDGEPTPGIDIEPQIAVDLAKKLGIKIYTIGIGDEHGGLWKDPLFGVRSMGFKLNTKLLHAIAVQTGGKFFLAKKPDELKHIYDIIDSLEKTDYEMPIFTHYTDLVLPMLFIILAFLCMELMATSFIWFKV
jgi:Ca-activated chloride channel homolog